MDSGSVFMCIHCLAETVLIQLLRLSTHPSPACALTDVCSKSGKGPGAVLILASVQGHALLCWISRQLSAIVKHLTSLSRSANAIIEFWQLSVRGLSVVLLRHTAHHTLTKQRYVYQHTGTLATFTVRLASECAAKMKQAGHLCLVGRLLLGGLLCRAPSIARLLGRLAGSCFALSSYPLTLHTDQISQAWSTRGHLHLSGIPSKLQGGLVCLGDGGFLVVSDDGLAHGDASRQLAVVSICLVRTLHEAHLGCLGRCRLCGVACLLSLNATGAGRCGALLCTRAPCLEHLHRETLPHCWSRVLFSSLLLLCLASPS